MYILIYFLHTLLTFKLVLFSGSYDKKKLKSIKFMFVSKDIYIIFFRYANFKTFTF